MRLVPARPGPSHPTTRPALAAADALALAAGAGLVGGFADLGMAVLRKEVISRGSYYLVGRFFPWTIPTASLVLLLVAGLAVAAVNRLRRGRSPRGRPPGPSPPWRSPPPCCGPPWTGRRACFWPSGWGA